MQIPRDIAQARIDLAGEASRLSDILGELLKDEADFFNTYRSDYKSDNATKKAFEATNKGVEMNKIKLRLKSIDREMSSLNGMLRVLENEAKNIF